MKKVDIWKGRATTRVATIIILATVSLTVSCRRQDDAAKTTELSADENARPISVFVVPESSASETRTFPVFVKGAASTKLSFRVPGKLEEYNVAIGKRFQKDEVVARLEARDYQLVVDRARQSLAEAQAALKAMETGARPEDVDSAEAALDAARSQRETAEKQFARVDALHRDGAASAMQFDLAKTTLDGAKAAELAAEKTLEKAKKGSRVEEIEMIKAKISGLEIDIQLAENKLSDVVLKAPFSGVISEKFAENHETVAPGVAIATLVDDAAFEGELSASEELPLRRDDVASITCVFDGVPNKEFAASLKETSTSTIKGNRAYLATLSIDASAKDGLLIGMVGVAKIALKDSGARVLAPASSLIPASNAGGEASKSCVWVVDVANQTVERREVKVGDLLNDRVEILDGLRPGETIAAAGARFLEDGQKIRLQNQD